MNSWQVSLIGSVLGTIIFYFSMSHIDKISQNIIKYLVNNLKPVRIKFFNNLREKRPHKINKFGVVFFVSTCIFLTIFSFMTAREFKMHTQLAPKEYGNNETTFTDTEQLNNILLNTTKELNRTAIESLAVGVLFLIVMIYKRAEVLLMNSMVIDFKNKLVALRKTKINDKEFVLFEFKWGSVNSFDEYNDLCREIDNSIGKW